MAPLIPFSNSGHIVIKVIEEKSGHCVCEMTLALEGQANLTKRFHGQSPKHAIAIGLESLAQTFRMEAETEQKVAWDAVDRSPSGEVNEKRFHVILHYETIAEEESKFEAMHNTLMGNTVVENAEITILQIDPDLAVDPRSKRHTAD